MDMNRYLIVVFCVITGCSSVISFVEADGFAIDNQQFVAWCNEHAQNIDKSYKTPILVEAATAESTKICNVNTENLLLLKNLPKLPIIKAIKSADYFVAQQQFSLCNTPVDCEISETVTVRGSNRIRAPGVKV